MANFFKKLQKAGSNPLVNIATGGLAGTAGELSKGSKANLGGAVLNQVTGGLAGTGSGNGIMDATTGLSSMAGTAVNIDPSTINTYDQAAVSQYAPLVSQYQQMADNSAVTSNVDPAFRNYQLGLAQQLQAQAAGQGPSVAQLQLQQATDRGLQQSLGAIRSATGANAGLAARTASLAGAQQLGQLGGQSAILRLQEQQQAQNALAGLAGQARQGDIATDQNSMSAQEATARNRLGALGGLSDVKRDLVGVDRDIFQAKTGANLATANNRNERTNQIIGAGTNILAAGLKMGSA